MNNNLGQIVLVKDINPGTSDGYTNNSYADDLIEFNDKLYFSADTEESGRELFVSDGTAEGTQLLADLNPGTDNYGGNSSAPYGFIEFNNRLYFAATNEENGRGLFVSNGTAEGTQLVSDISPNNFIEFNDRLYFSSGNSEIGVELFVSDGTTEGTQLLIDLNAGEPYYVTFEGDQPASSFPRNFIEFNDKLYFIASDTETDRELFVSDGTAEGTQLLLDVNNSSANSSFFRGGGDADSREFYEFVELFEFQDKLYFVADNGETGRELFVSDGTAEGTKLLVDLNPGVDGSDPTNFVEFNNKLYFAADNGESGAELFVTDGTEEGTQLVADINPGAGSSLSLAYFFSGISTAIIGYVDNNLTEFNDKLYFTANNGENGSELYVTDGTTEGTQLVEDINPATEDDYYVKNGPQNLTVFGDELFFTADNGETGRELFKLTFDNDSDDTVTLPAFRYASDEAS